MKLFIINSIIFLKANPLDNLDDFLSEWSVIYKDLLMYDTKEMTVNLNLTSLLIIRNNKEVVYPHHRAEQSKLTSNHLWGLKL